MALALGGLVGCSTFDAANPVAWYHDLEGGAIAEQRPPPPNSDAPYPNLASVPDRPVGSDDAARAGVADSLVADRSSAQYAAEAAPVPAAASIPTPPRAAAAAPDGSNATLAAASAAPAPPAPKAAPPAPVDFPPLGSAPLGQASTRPDAAIPDRPPPPPSLPGVVAFTAPTPPPKRPPAAAAVAMPVAGAPLAIAFPSGSALLPAEAATALQAMSRQRGAGAVNVVGFGEAQGTAPADQAAALPLALARARAVFNQLVAAGVPPNDVRIDAEASGAGAAARIVR